MKEIIFFTIFAGCFALSGCRDSPKIIRVDLIDRNTSSIVSEKPKSLRLVVEIDENGRLSLNKIETGTVRDLNGLNGKLEAIFEDRQKAGISEREVVIDPQSDVKNEDLEKLIESLAAAKAAPIRVIKTDREEK